MRDPAPAAVREALERVLASKAFSHSGRQSALLRFTVEQTLQGRASEIREQVLGAKTLERGNAFDPRIDPAVRVEAHRLRARLKAYYGSEGAADSVRIELPKGGYVPVFRFQAVSRRRWIFGAIAAASVVLGAVLYWAWPKPKTPAPVPPASLPPQVSYAPPSSIAVLPFADLSPERDQEYLCDGITDELTNTLAKIEGLRVVSRTSAFQFKGKASDVRGVGKQLNVGAVLEGSVRKTGDRLRVTAQLVKTSDGFQLWSATYDREIRDLFAIQAEIARAIAGALRGRLLAEPATAAPTTLEAYNLYLKGRFHWNKRSEQGLRKSLEYFEQAIGQDPNWAAAYAALADSHALLASYGFVPPREAMPKAKAATLKALELDDSLAQAHAALGFVYSFHDWDWAAAERAYRRALEINPGYATARQWYAGCLRAVGRLDDALEQARRAQDLDPLSTAIGRDLGRILQSKRQYGQAIEQYRKVLELDPAFSSLYVHLGMAYEAKAEFGEALKALEKARSLPGANPLALGALGHCRAASGDPAGARQIASELEALSRRRYVSPMSRALVFIGLGDRERAFQWLDRAAQERDPWLAWLNAEPVFDPLRPDPRFAALLERVGLTR